MLLVRQIPSLAAYGVAMQPLPYPRSAGFRLLGGVVHAFGEGYLEFAIAVGILDDRVGELGARF